MTIMKRTNCLRILVSCAATALPSLARAQANGTWLGPVSGSWTVGSFWSSNPDFPGNGGTATFADTGPQATVFGNGTLSLSALKFDSVAQVDIAAGAFPSYVSFTGPGAIEVPKYKQNKPGVTPYYLGHTLGTAISFNTGAINVTGPGAIFVNGNGSGFGADLSITNATYSTNSTYGFGIGSHAMSLDGATLRFVGGSGLSPQRGMMLGAGGATLELLNTVGTYNGVAITGSGPLMITGTGSLSLFGTCTFSGPTKISGGSSMLTVSGSGLVNTASISVSGQITLSPNASTTNMIPDNSELQLRGGSLTLSSQSTSWTDEHLGMLSMRGGLNTIVLNSANTTLRPSAMSRQDNAVMHFGYAGTPWGGSNSARMILGDGGASVPLLGGGGAAGTPSISIVPFAYADQTSQTPYGFVTYEANGFRPLAFNEYATTFSNSGSPQNIRLISGSTLTGANTYTVNSIASAGNFMNAVGGTGTIAVLSGALYNVGIGAPIDFGSTEGMVIAGQVNAPLSGSNGVTYTGNGSLALAITSTATSTYTGQTTIAGGTVSITSNVTPNIAGPFGADSSAIVLMGRTSGANILVPSSSSTIAFGRDLLVRSDPDLYNSNAPALRGKFNVTGNVTLEGPLNLDNDVTINGNISGPGRLVLTGTSQNFGTAVFLNGSNSFTGGVDVGTGTVMIGSDTALGAGAIYVGDGPAAGSGTVGTISQPVGPTRSLANPILLFDDIRFAVATNPITINGSVDLNGETRTLRSIGGTNPNHVNLNGQIKKGDLRIAGRFSIAGDNRQFSTTIDSGQATVMSNNGLGSAPRLTQLGSSLSTGNSVFLDLSGNITIPPHLLRIEGNHPGFYWFRSIGGSNTWSGDVQVIGTGTIQVYNLPPFTGPPALTILGGITGVSSGTYTTSIIKSEPGTLTTKYIRTPGELRISFGGGTVKIAPDGTDAATSNVGFLTLKDSSAKLDLTNNALVIDYASGSDPVATIRSELTSGYNNGAWNGNGINSSSAGANPGAALGWAESTDLFSSFPANFAGQTVDDSSLLVRYTLYGDANLDRSVDTIDFNILATNFSSTGQRWFTGDFNYDGSVDTVDFNLLVASFGQSLSAEAGRPSTLLVPEPLGSGLIVSALALLWARRRYRECRWATF